jgi:nucleoside-diphosphate-sugar epimerase
MRFIVTGGAGFIGHNVVRQLEALGHECIVLDCVTNYGFVNKAELEYLTQERRARMKAGIHYIDLRDHQQVKDFFRNFSVGCAGVIHLASFPRQKVVGQNPIWGSEVMATALVNLLECTKNFKISKFVYISSSMVYGDFDNDVTEDYDCRPQGQYGIMKLMGEHLVQDYTRRACFDHVIIRPSAVYGEFDVEDRVVSKFMLSALRGEMLRVNGANETLDFTYVEDAARGIVQAALSPTAVNQTYNITKSHSTTLLEAAQMALKIAGGGNLTVNNRDLDFPSRGALNIDAARRDFGFDPRVDVEEGFRRYYKWFESSSYWKTKLKSPSSV